MVDFDNNKRSCFAIFRFHNQVFNGVIVLPLDHCTIDQIQGQRKHCTTEKYLDKNTNANDKQC